VIPEIENAGLRRSALLPVVVLSIIEAAETQTAQMHTVEVKIDVFEYGRSDFENEFGMLRRTPCRP